jgi:predicted outer membrane lipoprotein
MPIINAMPNKSMDVRAKQLLSYYVAWLLSAGLAAVSPHVISIVRRFRLKYEL